jgi:hypothetical protein
MEDAMLRKVAWIAAISLMVAMSWAGTALAGGKLRTPAQIVAQITGKSLDEVETARAAGQSYVEQAKAAGKFDAFKAAELENCKLRLDGMVKDGKITQSEADAKFKVMTEWMQKWDGSTCRHGKGCKDVRDKGMSKTDATGNLNNAEKV